jgi:Na+/proline symporter
MQLQFIDWAIIIVYLLFMLAVGVIYTRRAGKSIKEFFLSGRTLPWWLVGTSMIATTFGADTPLAVTGLVRNEGGISGNWFWWAMLMGGAGMTGTIFFSRLWRRASVLTEPELAELRYGGKSAAVLRGFKSAYSSILYNCIIMAWVTKAMAIVLKIGLAIDEWQAVIIAAGIALFYSVMSGFWGVVITDFFQLIIAMGGSIVFAVIAVNSVGGMGALTQRLVESGRGSALNFMPDTHGAALPLMTFLVYVGMLWWCKDNADGGGYIIQRMSAAKTERHSFYATLWFSVGVYALRPWPWILVALASIVVLPDIAGNLAYPTLMYQLLPPGLLGLMLCAFLAAYMSTIDTHLNWGASYLVNDLYKRFIKRNASDGHYVLISRICTVALMGMAALTTAVIGTIEGAWKFLAALGSGVGLVLMLRWFWWRVNAWSEIAGMSTSLVVSLAMAIGLFSLPVPPVYIFPATLVLTVSLSICVWLTITMLTKPTEIERLAEFYLRVRPTGFWGPVRRKLAAEGRLAGDSGVRRFGLLEVFAWFSGLALVYGATFGIGKLVLGMYLEAAIYLLIAFAGGAVVAFAAKKFFSPGRYRESAETAAAVQEAVQPQLEAETAAAGAMRED